jgi:hypothetical protein
MKIHKLILCAITVLTITGGMLAFRIQKGTIIYTGPFVGAACTNPLWNATMAAFGSPAIASPIFNAPCVATFTIENE